MQYRSCRPLFLQLLYCQSFKQLPLSLKVGLQCGYEQTLSEPPGPAQKVISSLAHQLVDKLSLVYIEISVLAEALKVLYADRVFHIFVDLL